MALSVLSGLSLNDLAIAVVNKEIGRLTKIPGVGKKTAERLLLELQGKFVVSGANVDTAILRKVSQELLLTDPPNQLIIMP